MCFMKPFFLCGYAALYRFRPALGPHHLISANKTVLAVVLLGAGRLKQIRTLYRVWLWAGSRSNLYTSFQYDLHVVLLTGEMLDDFRLIPAFRFNLNSFKCSFLIINESAPSFSRCFLLQNLPCCLSLCCSVITCGPNIAATLRVFSRGILLVTF